MNREGPTKGSGSTIMVTAAVLGAITFVMFWLGHQAVVGA